MKELNPDGGKDIFFAQKSWTFYNIYKRERETDVAM